MFSRGVAYIKDINILIHVINGSVKIVIDTTCGVNILHLLVSTHCYLDGTL
jgi:hypothetical protein